MLNAVMVPYGGLSSGNPCTVMPRPPVLPAGGGANPCTISMSD